jgi:hypothetical protein
MAYFCLTILEAKTGGRESAATAYRIEKAVLNRMGELTSLRGDRLTARKATGVQPLTGQERAWLEAAVKMLIWRLGDTRTLSNLPVITMSDLPMI